MRKIKLEHKKQIIGGLSFWTFAMGASLLIQVLSTQIFSILSLTLGGNDNDNQTINNSWSANYNQYNPTTQKLSLKFGLTPKQSSMFLM